AEGRTVLVSSHLMSEMEHTADRLVVIGRGELIAEESVTAFAMRGTRAHVSVRTPEPAVLASALIAEGAGVRPDGEGTLAVTGLTAARIGEIALDHRIVLHGLVPGAASLEEAFMELTADRADYRAGERR
ncbi:ABC transporter ATP-binding protein, partial [Kitasatospora sp. NPDC057198]